MTHLATTALFDTGATNFIAEDVALKLNPSRSLFMPHHNIIELGNRSTMTADHVMRLLITLEPIPNYPSQSITITAIITPTLPFPVIIGNTAIHNWNLYPWLANSNTKQRAMEQTPLARMLQRPKKIAPSDQDTASVTSAFTQAEWRRIDGIDHIDDDIDDCPPSTFPLTLEQDITALPSTPITFARLTAANLHQLSAESNRLVEPDDYHDGDSSLDDITLFNPNEDDEIPSQPRRTIGSSPYDDWPTQQDQPTPTNEPTSEDYSTAPAAEVADFEKTFKALIHPALTAAERKRIATVLFKHRKRFSDQVHPDGAKVPPMDLKLKPGVEIPKALRGRARKVAKIIDDEVHETCRKNILLGIISEVSSADIYSQVLIVQRKTIGPDGETVTKSRFCIDYRHLNLITETYHFPLPLIDDLIRALAGNTVFSSLDLTQGFHQCKLTKNAARLTAFMTSRGMFQYERVPFGLTGGPAYFQAMIQNHVLKGLAPSICMVYIDDIIIFGRDHEEHARNLATVLQRLGEFNITIKPGKSLFGSPEVNYLGHTVNKEGVSISQHRKMHITKMRQPHSISELHSFIGVANFLRQYIKQFASIAAPLYAKIASKKRPSSKVDWDFESQQAYDTLKKAIEDAPLLKFLQDEGDVVLFTDASDIALGGHLVQYIDGTPNTICFVSKKFTDVQTRWSTTEKELYAIVYCVLKLRAMLGGRKFTVRTDHQTLTHWNSINDTPKVYRWKQRLLEFDFDVIHIEGKDNCIADALSRLCFGTTITEDSQSTPSSPTPSSNRSATSTSVTTSDSEADSPHDSRQQYLDIIAKYHNDFVGHTNTLQRLRHDGHDWHGITAMVKSYISRCDACQLVNPHTKPRRGVHFTLVTPRPFQRCYIDTMGPRDGDPTYRYIVVFVDAMSRFVRLFPVVDVSASIFARVLETYILQTPKCETFYFDNHGQFNNTLVNQVLTKFGKEELNSTPYSHQENGLVERTIESVQLHFERWRLHHPDEPWSTFLPYCERILCSTPIQGTNYTPIEIVYGSIAKDSTTNLPTVTDYVTHVDQTRAIAISNHDSKLDAHVSKIDQHNRQKQSSPLSPGTKVMITNMTKTKSFSSLRNTGPFTVIRQTGNTVYVSDLEHTGIERPVNIKRCKVLTPDFPTTTTHRPLNFFEVEKILSHRITSKGNLIVTVQWTGFEETSEENISTNPSIRRTEAFYNYCNNNSQLQKFITGIVLFRPQDVKHSNS